MLQMMEFNIKNIPAKVFLGIGEGERSMQQKILISVKFEVETHKAEISDNIEDTVDYFQVYEFVQHFPGMQNYNLVEKLHHDLFEALIREFPKIKNLSLKIEKFPFEEGSVVVEN